MGSTKCNPHHKAVSYLHISGARVPDGPYVEQTVQAELHALVLEQLDVGVGARQVDYNLALLRRCYCRPTHAGDDVETRRAGGACASATCLLFFVIASRPLENCQDLVGVLLAQPRQHHLLSVSVCVHQPRNGGGRHLAPLLLSRHETLHSSSSDGVFAAWRRLRWLRLASIIFQALLR